MKFLMLGLLTGIDNLVVSSGFGAVSLGSRDRLKLVVSVACFETLMPVLGFFLASRTFAGGAEWLGPACLLLCGILVAWRVLTRRVVNVERPIVSTASLVLIPLFLSLDNLAAGASLGAFGASNVLAAVVTGCVAACISLAGLRIGSLAAKRFSFNPQLACATCLIVLGVAGLCVDI